MSNEVKTPKATYLSAVNFAIDNLPNAPEDVLERLNALAASLSKKSENRKSAADTDEAKEARAAIYEYLLSLPEDEKRTITELTKEVPYISGWSGPKTTTRVGELIDEGKVVRITDKRRSYFKAVR